MKKIVILIMMCLFTGCMVYTGYYNIGLSEVEKPEDSKIRYGNAKLESFEEEGKTKYSYEDSLIQIIWLPLSTQFSFSLKNKTSHSIKIIWDEAVFVNENGSSQRVFHSGVKYIDRNASQPSTVIVKGATIEDIVVPTDNVYYVSGQYGGWRTSPIFPNRAATQDELDSLTEKYIGKTIMIQLPIEIEGIVNEYLFSFNVEGFIKT